jgi:hypothetical protein
MFFDIFNPRKRAASRELEVGLYYLLHDARAVVPLLKESYKDRWPGFIEDILKGARPYEEATVIIGIFLQSSFQGLHPDDRGNIMKSIESGNVVNPPNLLRIVGQVTYLLHLAKRDKYVREKCWIVWVNDMTKMFVEVGNFSEEHCGTYLISLANSYRDAKQS